MTAGQVLALAEDLRWFARQMGRDLNAANLFVHTMLVRALKEAPDSPFADEDDDPFYESDDSRAA
jgi:hypothetical protein